MYRTTSQRAQPTDTISISCRFVATDQWLRTHVDPAWTVLELKRHLLARCVGGVPLEQGSFSLAPRLLVPSQAGRATLAALIRPPQASILKSSTRPSTAPHATYDEYSRRKPRLSLKVVPGLSSKPTPRTVTIHPPTPGFGFGAPLLAATGPPPPPPVYFSTRNLLSSPELSPPQFVTQIPSQPLEDGYSPSSPNAQLDTASVSSRSTSTVALGYSQPQSHTTSPTFSSGTSPPSRPFSPTSLPPPVDSQPLFGPDHSTMFGDLIATSPSATSLRARSTPPLVRAMSTPPSPYSPKPPTPVTSRPHSSFPLHIAPNSPPATARSPPLSSSFQSQYDMSRLASNASMTTGANLDSTRSAKMSVLEFLDSEEPRFDGSNNPDGSSDAFARSSSPPVLGTDFIKYERRDSREDELGYTGWEEEFRLVSFAMGSVLDEHVSLADLKIRPGELLEIQRTNATVHLARPTYTQPYFEGHAYVLKRPSSTYIRPHHSSARGNSSHNQHPYSHHHQNPHSRPHQHHIQPLRDYGPPYPPLPLPLEPLSPIDHGSNTRIRSGTITARDAWDSSTTVASEWDVDGEGDADGSWAELELSGLEGVNGGLSTAGSGSTTRGSGGWGEPETGSGPGLGSGSGSDKIEWKLRWIVMREGRLSVFRSRMGSQICTRSVTSILSAQQLPAAPAHGSLPRHYIKLHLTGSSRQEREKHSEGGLRMMDGAAHAHFLRVLLRIINTSGSHAFLPTDTPYISSAPLASQYPEWRQHIVQRAWIAGRGTSQLHSGIVTGPWLRAPWSGLSGKELEMLETLEDSDESGGTGSPTSDAGNTSRYDIDEDAQLEDEREDDSEIEWNVEGWRDWESENAFGVRGGSGGSGNSWIRGKPEISSAGRPRSRSLAAPMSRSASQQQSQPSQQTTPQQTYAYSPQQPYGYQPEGLLSPVSTVSSEMSSISPSTRRGRSSTFAGAPPESPGSTSPSAWSPVSSIGPGAGSRRPTTGSSSGGTGVGIETVLRSSEPVRRASAQAGRSGRSEVDRRGSANSLEMQRAAPPNRRAVTGPAAGGNGDGKGTAKVL